MEQLPGYSRMGASWEGFVIENIIARLPEGGPASFFRTAAGAEIDRNSWLWNLRPLPLTTLRQPNGPQIHSPYHAPKSASLP